MTRKAKLAKQAIFAAASNMMLALTFVMVILVGRYLGPDVLGLFSYAQSLAMIVVGFGNFGLSTLVVRDVAKNKDLGPSYFAVMVPWVALLTTVICLGMIGALALSRPDDIVLIKVCALMGAAVAIRAVGMLIRSFLQGMQKFGIECGAVALENLVMIPVGALLLMAGYDIIAFAAGLMISRLAGTLFMLGGLRRVMKLRLAYDPPKLISLQKQSLSIGLSQNIHFASIHIDTLLLSWFLPISAAAAAIMVDDRFHQIGQFNAAFKIYIGSMLVPMMAVSLLLPKLSASMVGSKQNHNALLVAGLVGMLGMSVCAAGVGYLIAPWGIHLLYGEGYEEAVPVMRLLLIAMIPTYIYYFMNSYLVVIGRNRAYLGVSTLGLVVRVAMCTALMRVMGIRGAALAVIIAESTVVVVIWIYLLRVHFKPGSPKEVVTKLRMALSAIAMRE